MSFLYKIILLCIINDMIFIQIATTIYSSEPKKNQYLIMKNKIEKTTQINCLLV